MSQPNRFHEGERAVQDRVGQRALADRHAAIIGDVVPPGARRFLATQRMLVVASVDAGLSPHGETPWASLLPGAGGFVTSSDDGRRVEIDVTRARVFAPADILWTNLDGDARVSLLAIELATRRRLRVNGRVTSDPAAPRLVVEVDAAYPQCPKYIQRRHMGATVGAQATGAVGDLTRGDALTPDQTALIAAADTMFVASVAPAGADVSHRGGPPGFVEVCGPRRLRVPDYAGNGMFNTLGNLELHPRAGLLFPDFAGDRVLQVAGAARVLHELDDPRGATGGTRRFWELEVEQVRAWRSGARTAWELLDRSPHNPSPDDPGPGDPAPRCGSPEEPSARR